MEEAERKKRLFSEMEKKMKKKNWEISGGIRKFEKNDVIRMTNLEEHLKKFKNVSFLCRNLMGEKA